MFSFFIIRIASTNETVVGNKTIDTLNAPQLQNNESSIKININDEKPLEKIPVYFENKQRREEIGIRPEQPKEVQNSLTIVKVDPLILNPSGGQDVTIKYTSAAKIDQKFGKCRFGQTIVDASIYNDEFHCLSVASKKALYVSISVDGESWAKNDILVSFQAPLTLMQILFDIVACFAVFSGLPAVLCPNLCKKRSSNFNINTAEEVPLATAKEQLFDDFA